jgi:hypothetical protein
VRIHKLVPTSKVTKKPPIKGGKFVRLNQVTDQAAKRIRERSFLEKAKAAVAPSRGTGPGTLDGGVGAFAVKEPPTWVKLSGLAAKSKLKVWVKFCVAKPGLKF